MNTKKLRQKILDLAIHGKLVAQNSNDEPASELLKRIRAEKEQLIEEGKIKKTKTTDSSHYENVPFEIPNSWEWTTVNYISISILYGVSESAKNYGKYKLLRITDIQNNQVEWESVPYTDFDTCKASLYLLKDNDILFARTGATVGKSYLVQGLKQDAIYASYLIRVQTSNTILPKYVKYYFESGYYWEQILQESVGVGQPNVNGTILGNLKIPLPPLAEQKRIVEAIDKWFALIDSIENNKADLETTIKQTKNKILDLAIHGKLVAQNPNDEPASELLKRINPKAEIISNSDEYGNLPFDIPKNWCWCKLSNISNIYTGNSINENEKKSQYTDVLGTEYIATKDVEFDNSINYKNGISIPEKYIKNFRIAPANSVLMCIEGGSAGRKIGILSQSVCFGNKLCCFSPYANDISSMYIFYYLQSPLFFEIFNSNKNGIIGGVSINNLKKLLFPLPPLAEQKRIVEAIDKAFKYLDAIAESL